MYIQRKFNGPLALYLSVEFSFRIKVVGVFDDLCPVWFSRRVDLPGHGVVALEAEVVGVADDGGAIAACTRKVLLGLA